MAAEGALDDDDAWLYGDNNNENQRKEEINAIFDRATEEVPVPGEENIITTNGDFQMPSIDHEDAGQDEEAKSKGNDDEKESDDDEESDDDDVQITIGDIKPATYSYPGAPVNLNIKRGAAFASGAGATTTSKSAKGIDLESAGLINGINLYEFNLDSIEDKPWRKPGADITDYFNYGFNEDTWKAYCEKQRKLRLDNNVVPKHSSLQNIQLIPGKDQHIPTATVNENSKYSGALTGPKKAGPPPGRRSSGSIDVICGATSSRRSGNTKENVIQVIGSYDGTLPPGLPPTHIPPPFIPPNLSVPPPGLPPGIPSSIPPPGALQGHVPYPDLYGNPIFSQPPPVAVSGNSSSRGFDNNSESQHSWNNSPHRDRDRERNRDKDRERDHYWEERRRERREVPEEEYKRRERDDYDRRRYRDYRERRDRDRYEKDYDRDYDRDYYERDRERDRDSREKDRDRRHRDHKDKEKEERGDKDKDRRSSRRRHHHEEEEEDRHSSSRHKHKKSKREKDETSNSVLEGSESTQPENPEEENK